MTDQVYLEDIEVGMEVPTQEYGPWSNAHIARWCAAQENWERFHYDYKFATSVFQLDDIVANGNWRKHPVARVFKDWAGHGGWLWKLQMQYRAMHYPFDVFTVWARVREMREIDGVGIVDLDCGMRNQNGQETSPGSAVVAIPLKNGPDVSYPFVPPQELQEPDDYYEPGHNMEGALYVNDEVRSQIGLESEGTSWDSVSLPELRRFSQAIPDPDRLYWDEDYAKSTRWGSVMAMPLYPVDGFKHPPTEPDQLTRRIRENPNYWGGPPGVMSGERDHEIEGLPTQGGLNGGQSYEVLGLARLGEKLSRKSRLLDIYERQGSKNRLVFTVTGTTYYNSDGEVILKGKGVGISRG